MNKCKKCNQDTQHDICDNCRITQTERLKLLVLIQGFIIVALAGNMLLSKEQTQQLETPTQAPAPQVQEEPSPQVEEFSDEVKVEDDFVQENTDPTETNLIFEDNLSIFDLADENGFVIDNGVLVRYIGGKTTVTIPETVTTIGEDAFKEMIGIINITIPETVTRIEDRAFYGLDMLSYLTYSNSIEYVGKDAFTNTKWYENLSQEYNIIGDGVLIKYVSSTDVTNNNNPNIITLPNTIKSISGKAFSHCTNLQSVTIPETVTHIGESAFESCWILDEINIPSSVEFIGDYAFNDTTWFYDLEDEFCIAGASTLIKYNGIYNSISIPNFITNISAVVFQNFNSIETINIPDTVTRIGEKAFDGCISLNSLNIPDSVTYIGDDAFFDTVWFINLNETINLVGDGILVKYTGNSADVIISEPVKAIYQNVFENSKSMSKLIIETEVDINQNALNYNNYIDKIVYENAPIKLQKIIEKYDEINQNVILTATILSQQEYLKSERTGEMEYHIYVLEDNEVTVIPYCDTGHPTNAEWKPSLKDGYQIVIINNGEILFANLY